MQYTLDDLIKNQEALSDEEVPIDERCDRCKRKYVSKGEYYDLEDDDIVDWQTCFIHSSTEEKRKYLKNSQLKPKS